jgi:hypothetical protein
VFQESGTVMAKEGIWQNGIKKASGHIGRSNHEGVSSKRRCY